MKINTTVVEDMNDLIKSLLAFELQLQQRAQGDLADDVAQIRKKAESLLILVGIHEMSCLALLLVHGSAVKEKGALI